MLISQPAPRTLIMLHLYTFTYYLLLFCVEPSEVSLAGVRKRGQIFALHERNRRTNAGALHALCRERACLPWQEALDAFQSRSGLESAHSSYNRRPPSSYSQKLLRFSQLLPRVPIMAIIALRAQYLSSRPLIR